MSRLRIRRSFFIIFLFLAVISTETADVRFGLVAAGCTDGEPVPPDPLGMMERLAVFDAAVGWQACSLLARDDGPEREYALLLSAGI